MIIKEIELENIRSYEKALITLPLGRTLFEGDIGSGKSSLLMAIEFSLFGLGSEAGPSILRLGEAKGAVWMRFEADGGEFEVTRRLERKGGRVQQTAGHLKTPDEELDLSPSELKERVLEILGFNEVPDPKAQSWIYRYAVYTPQEEMKQVLALSPDLRLQILRRAFRVEDYKTAAENSLELQRAIRGDVRELDGVADGLGRLKEQLDGLRREERDAGASLEVLQERESVALDALDSLKLEKSHLWKEELELAEVRSERQLQEKLEKQGRRNLDELGTAISELDDRIRELDGLVQKKAGKAPGRVSAETLRKRERALQEKENRLRELKGKVGAKLSEYESIMDDGVCPVCDREVEASSFLPKKTKKAAELAHVAEELSSVESQLKEVGEGILSLEKREREKERTAELKLEMTRLKKELTLKTASRVRITEETQAAAEKLASLAEKMSALKGLESEIRENDVKLARAETDLKGIRDSLAGGRRDLALAVRRQGEVSQEVTVKETAADRRDALRQHELWLSDYFVPTVQMIEKSVLASMNQEFDALFRKWFVMLVSDPDKEVRVDEDFTPVVTQDGYEQDVWYLSGGEKTSVALAYRLALNTLAQRVSTAMKSNLLILDEPTDGFSQEQLGNVREVLDDVASPQVIIVSHDRELESLADQIFRVSKVRGKSVVEILGS